MKVRLISIPVLDQEKAFKFYTEKLGFIVKHDIPLGEGNRWLTLVSNEDQEGPEVLLEPAPLHFEPAKVFQSSLYSSGIPWTQFDVDDMESEYTKLKELGVEFSMVPKDVGSAIVSIFDDTCGNKIQLVQPL